MGSAMYDVLTNPHIVITQLPLTQDYCCYLSADEYPYFEPIFVSQSHSQVVDYVKAVFPLLKVVEQAYVTVADKEVLVL